MRTLLVHPSGLMYSEIFLRLEPLGLERVAGAARAAGHQVRLLDRKHLGVAGLAQASGIAGQLLLRGQTNFVRMLWQFSRVYNETRQLADHERTVQYELPVPEHCAIGPVSRGEPYIHPKRGRRAAAP